MSLANPWLYTTLTLALGVLVAATPAAAFLRQVDCVNGNDTGNCTTTPCKTIRYAEGQALPRDTVRIATGTCNENVVITKSLSLVGQGCGNTMIDGGGQGSVVRVQNGPDVYIKNLTVQNGQAVDGGGIANVGSRHVRVVSVCVQHNKAIGSAAGEAARGGGIFSTSRLTVHDSFITQNLAQGAAGGEVDTCLERGGAGLGGGIYSIGHLHISRSTIRQNQAIGGDAIHDGGSGDGQGGGIYSVSLGHPVRVEGSGLQSRDSVIEGNQARAGKALSSLCFDGYGTGGGVYVDGNFLSRFTHITNNLANAGAGIASHAFQSSASNVQLRFANLRDNVASLGDGGGIRALCANTLPCTLSISDTTIARNQATRGGGLLTSGASAGAVSKVFLDRTTVNDNTAVQGGGIWTENQQGGRKLLRLRNSTVSSNHATGGIVGDGLGGGIVALSNSGPSSNDIRLIHSTIAHNSASVGGGGIYAAARSTHGEHTNVYSKNGLIVNNTGGDCHFADSAALFPTGNNMDSDTSCATAAGAVHFVSADPLLAPLVDNGGPTVTHALLAGSPAIDAASSCAGLTQDQRAMPRPGVGGSATRCDLGAFEF